MPTVAKALPQDATPVAAVTLAVQSKTDGAEVVSENVIVPVGSVKPESVTEDFTVAESVTGCSVTEEEGETVGMLVDVLVAVTFSLTVAGVPAV